MRSRRYVVIGYFGWEREILVAEIELGRGLEPMEAVDNALSRSEEVVVQDRLRFAHMPPSIVMNGRVHERFNQLVLSLSELQKALRPVTVAVAQMLEQSAQFVSVEDLQKEVGRLNAWISELEVRTEALERGV